MATPIPFRRVAILGTGLIGVSFALALRKQFPDVTLVGFDRSGAANQAVAYGIVDKITPDLATAVQGSDLVYIAMPIGAMIEALPAIAAAAESHALVTD